MPASKEPVEFVLAGVAGCCAGVFSNPLDVVKTRMQLQGELRARGQYQVYYRNLFHATYVIARTDGLRGIQSGLAPALVFQFIMNGVRLGTYQTLTDLGWTHKPGTSGEVSYPRSVMCGALAGGMGTIISSPIYMIKNQLQAKSNPSIAVGYQYQHTGMRHAFKTIFRDHGVLGLWRGVDGALLRVTIGSAVQLSTFTNIKAMITDHEIFRPNSLLITVCASCIGAAVVVTGMTPFDLVSTRLYNQGIDKHGKGLYYNNIFDCIRKVFQQEGFRGFYKGWTASCFRLAPHTILCLSFWDGIRFWYFKYFPKEL